jgi:hypothetical protein
VKQAAGEFAAALDCQIQGLKAAKDASSVIRCAVTLAGCCVNWSLLGAPDVAEQGYAELEKVHLPVGEPTALFHSFRCNRALHLHRYGDKVQAKRDYQACVADEFSPHRYADSRLHVALGYALFQSELGKAVQADALLKRAGQVLASGGFRRSTSREQYCLVGAEIALHAKRLSRAEFDLRRLLGDPSSARPSDDADQFDQPGHVYQPNLLQAIRARDCLSRVLLAQCQTQQNLDSDGVEQKKTEAMHLLVEAISHCQQRLDFGAPLYLRCSASYIEWLNFDKQSATGDWLGSVLPWFSRYESFMMKDDLSGESCGLAQVRQRLLVIRDQQALAQSCSSDY